MSCLGFLATGCLTSGWGAPAVAAVSVVCTVGEIVYAGSATALVTAHVLGRALARFRLSTGLGLAVSPAVITALAPHGPAALGGSLSAATLLAAVVVTEKDRETAGSGSVVAVRADAPRGRGLLRVEPMSGGRPTARPG